MRCRPRITAIPWLAAVVAGAGCLAEESVLSHHGLATELVPGDARFDVLLPPAYGPDAMGFLERRFGQPVDTAYWRARHPPTIVIDNADRLRDAGLQLLVEAGDEDANLTFLSAELVHRLLFDAAIEHEYHLIRGAAHTGRSVPRRLDNVFGFFQRALRPEGPDPAAQRHLAQAKRSGRYAPRVPNQLDFETVEFGRPGSGGDAGGEQP